MTRRSRSSASGQTLVIFALCFALVLFALICLVADAAFMFRWSDRVQAAAQLAAESGADSVDPHYLYAGSCSGAASCNHFIVDISAADRNGRLYAFQSACIQAGDQSAGLPLMPNDTQSPQGTACDSDGCRVFAVVSRQVTLPIGFPGFPATITVRGTAFAAPVVGANRAASVCSGGDWVPAPPG